VPLIQASIEKLGFNCGHEDSADQPRALGSRAGSAKIKELTGAATW